MTSKLYRKRGQPETPRVPDRRRGERGRGGTQVVVGHGRGAGPVVGTKRSAVPSYGARRRNRFPVELAVATVEGGVGEEAAPWLGKEGEAGKARGLVRQFWRQRRQIVRRARRQRRHGLLGELGKPKAGEEMGSAAADLEGQAGAALHH
jgi:hypothetical protein